MAGRALAMGKGELLMWTYDKVLEYPVNIKCRNPKLAQYIISQYGRTRWRTSELHLDIYHKDLECQIKKQKLY